jgi:hypothetical protein
MPVRDNCLALAIALSAVLATCSDGGPAPTPEPKIELTRSGACGDADFWAATESGDIAVTVTVDAHERVPCQGPETDPGSGKLDVGVCR